MRLFYEVSLNNGHITILQREWLQRDVDRERRLRLDTEARLKGSSSEADRCRAKLSALQKDFTK